MNSKTKRKISLEKEKLMNENLWKTLINDLENGQIDPKRIADIMHRINMFDYMLMKEDRRDLLGQPLIRLNRLNSTVNILFLKLKETMVRLKLLTMHKIDDVPDHILEEMQQFAVKLTLANKPLIENTSPNIALAGLNWMTCVMIKHLVAENPGELRKAAKMSCQMLLNNMEILIDQMESEKKEQQIFYHYFKKIQTAKSGKIP